MSRAFPSPLAALAVPAAFRSASARWLGLRYECPEGTDIVHTKAEHGFALRTGKAPLVMTLAHSVFDPLLLPYKSTTTKAYHALLKRGEELTGELARSEAGLNEVQAEVEDRKSTRLNSSH